MKKASEELLAAPLSAHEARWADELVDKLPEDVDLTFAEIKVMTRLSVGEWPSDLMDKVRDVIDVKDFVSEDPD